MNFIKDLLLFVFGVALLALIAWYFHQSTPPFNPDWWNYPQNDAVIESIGNRNIMYHYDPPIPVEAGKTYSCDQNGCTEIK